MKILYFCNVPAPYRVDFLNELGKKCDLTVLFEKNTSDERNKSWKNYSFDNCKGIVLKGISISTDSAICFSYKKYLRMNNDVVIFADYSTITEIIGIMYCIRKKIPYGIEVDGGIHGSGKGIKEKLKTFILSHASYAFSSGKQTDDYYSFYGIAEKDIKRYPFTSLRDNDIFSDVSSKDEKANLRKKLRVAEKRIIVTVGRFSYLNGYGKGYDVIIKAAKNLNKDIGWYIIGGQPTDEFRRIVEESAVSNVHFIDFLDKAHLKEYYRAADLFVLMTLGEAWGLVINEAMACGLPVITTDKCVAGLELIDNGKNGYVLNVGDVDGLCECVSRIVYNEKLLADLGKRAIFTINDYTIEKMAETHLNAFREKKE